MDDLQFLPSIRMKTVIDLNRGTIGILKCCSITTARRRNLRLCIFRATGLSANPPHPWPLFKASEPSFLVVNSALGDAQGIGPRAEKFHRLQSNRKAGRLQLVPERMQPFQFSSKLYHVHRKIRISCSSAANE